MVVMMTVCAVLAVGCITADELLPRIPPVERFIRSLPLEDEERTARRGME